MIAYLDTNVVIWLAARDLARISAEPLALINQAQLLISPIIALELQYLFEVGSIRYSPADIQLKLTSEIPVTVCDLPFSMVAETAMGERWTREPFDRLIVAQAKARGFASLITADSRIRENYPRAVW